MYKAFFVAFALFLSFNLFSLRLCAQFSLPVDSNTQSQPHFFQSRAVKMSIVPVLFFAGTAATWSARKDVRELRNRYIPTFRYHFDDYLQYAPAVTVFALNAAGVKGKHKTGRTLVSYGFSAAIMAALVNTIKHTTKIERPDGSANNSFPSGHTANSFMNATFLHEEYGTFRSPLYSIGAYTAATATAVGRQLNNRHWVSDVLAGAGIGILSTELGYYIAEKIFKDKQENFKPARRITVQDHPSFIELKMGYALALGTDLSSPSSELYAKTGFNFGAEGAWFFHKNIGIGGDFSFSSFPINDSNLNIEDPELLQISNGHYTQPVGIRYLHAGPFFSLPLPNRWFVTAKLNAGTAAGVPGQIIFRLKPEYQEVFQAKELPLFRYKPETVFSWSAGLGIQKQIRQNLGVKAYVSYFDSDNTFSLAALNDVDDQGHAHFLKLGREKIKFNHLTFGLGLTAYLW
jgi:membrane-associated phospholipid phosphatase